MSRKKLLLFSALLSTVVAILVSAILVACSQTPTSVPVRTFERAQRMDVACMQLYDPATGNPREPIGRRQEECQPVPVTADGNAFGKQLYAFVTQTTRGELAVVNLSAGGLVDQSRATPGVNFLPVGQLPTDVATTPDGKMAFVAAAETNKPAIYGIPTRRLLGDTDIRFPKDPDPLTLGSWPVCALPQNPGAVAVVPRKVTVTTQTPPADGGGGDGGDAGDAGTTAADAGAGGAEIAPEYDLVVVLPGDRLNSAKIVTLDVRPFRRGGLAKDAKGNPDYASDHLASEPATLNAGPILQPGQLAACPITSAIELVGSTALPKTVASGPAWEDGVKYTDGGVDLTCLRPTRDQRCGLRPCCDENPGKGLPDAAGVEGGVFEFDAGTCEAVPAVIAEQNDAAVPLNLGPLDPPRLVSVARDDQTLYVADEAVPLIHVLDMTPVASGAPPRELAPLVASSLADPSRVVKVKQIALSPPTRDFKRFLYAVDQIDGSIMVYDVTDPNTAQRTPLTRPHPELNPFQPIDRLSFTAPVVAVEFARHDLPLALQAGVPVPSAGAGILCNPNHNLDGNPQADLGYYYRASSTDPGDPIGPRRMRGIFAFATLSNGNVFAIDVDDWDSPCRRPSDMSFPLSDITPAEPAASGAGDLNPYHSPNPADAGGIASDPAVTLEGFFPMAVPHAPRSSVLITNDPTTGDQLPRLQGTQIITANSIVLPQSGDGSENTPLLTVGFANELPQVHVDQDWALTWEGALPGFDGVSGVLTTDDNYGSLIMSANAHFCAKGVEDRAQGILRTDAVALAESKRGFALPANADHLTADYVQLTEDLLDPIDDYWAIPQDCWDSRLPDASTRYNICDKTFGAGVDAIASRDFPILEASDGKVRLGRFFSRNPKAAREIVYSDPSNADQLKLMKCCFHNQVRFHVRTGNLWSAVGSALGGGPGVGFFSHLTTDPAGRCVPSCEAREALLNGRLYTAPNGFGDVGRNSALALRNPMLDMRIIAGADGAIPLRDTAYTFSTRGQFQPLIINIAGGSTAVDPQSMHYVEALGQMAVVDGASQGLVLIDLRAVTLARAPYF